MAKEICPMCGGNSLYVTQDRSLRAYCFLCSWADFTGDYKSIERYHDVKSIRQFYKEISSYYHSCLTEDARAYLLSRGFDDNTIQTLQLGYCPNDTHILYQDPIAKVAGLVTRKNNAFFANRVTFPYLYNDQVTDIRARSLEKETEYRYLSPKGSSYFRGADYPYMYEDDNNTLIVEGEIKAYFAKKTGYKVNGLPGINSARPKTNGTIVCFDSSRRPKSRTAVFRAILSLGKRIPNLKVAQLPLAPGEIDIGIDDYILKYGFNAFRAIVDHAIDIRLWKRIHVI